MPTYEYVCGSCGADFDVFQSMSDAPLKVCPTCGKAVRRKINGGTGIIFKGSGFYKNDSRKSSPSGGESRHGSSKSAHGEESNPVSASQGESHDGGAPAAKPSESVSSSSASEAPKKDAT
jgi:putative FmdB family regulatory protein